MTNWLEIWTYPNGKTSFVILNDRSEVIGSSHSPTELIRKFRPANAGSGKLCMV